MNVCTVRRKRPGASSMLPMRDCARALPLPMPAAIASIPTGATSPSSSALVACVVECAMSTTSPAVMPPSSISRDSDCTIPAATPRLSVWVVGTFAVATSSKFAASIATAWVKVPPTSMPTRILRFAWVSVTWFPCLILPTTCKPLPSRARHGCRERVLRARSRLLLKFRPSPASPSTRLSPSAMPSRCGSTSSAASPSTSGSEEVLDATTGAPHAIASTGGRPNPSYSEGNASASQQFMKSTTSSSGRWPMNRIRAECLAPFAAA